MLRIGHAWDTHRLVLERRLVLGGVEFESSVGLLGHSDADVVLHAIAESFLGSLALGDLGHGQQNHTKGVLSKNNPSWI